MPTYGRPDFVEESIAFFLAQDYPRKELIIINDCPGQTFTGHFPDVVIINLPDRCPSLGEKRNLGIEMARGDLIAVWDDDDIYLPWRLSFSVRRIRELNSILYCPSEYWYYTGSEILSESRSHLDWIYHPLLIFAKETWRAVGGYPLQTLHEDTVFCRKVFQQFEISWQTDDVPRWQRSMILRVKSKYRHTSIDGGLQPPDTQPRNILLNPCPLRDRSLREGMESLIHRNSDEQQNRALSAEARKAWPGVCENGQRTWLDHCDLTDAKVGYGELGRDGRLGYESKRVEINGEFRIHSLSAHAPSSMKFAMDGRYTHFCCQVALNDDVPIEATTADFFVFADKRLVASALNIGSGNVPRQIAADIRGARELELVVEHHQSDCCHAVWVDPILVN